MPLREYICEKCGDFEVLYSTTEEQKTVQECPECGALCPQKMSVSNFVLKGDGWYATDYKNNGGKK